MADTEYAKLARLTVAQLGISLILMRDGTATLVDIAAALGRWFGLEVTADDCAVCYEHLRTVGWVIATPRCDAVVVSQEAEDAVYRAVGGIVRIIDFDRGIWDAAAVWQIVKDDLRLRRH